MKKVLFVCQENSCRSQMAKGFYNALTKSELADSAGMQPAEHVDPYAVMAMKEIGIDISKSIPKKLTNDMNNKFDIIVTMGCINGCPITPLEKTVEWNIDDPKGKPMNTYRAVRDIIKNHVEQLIKDTKDDLLQGGNIRQKIKLNFHF